MVEHIWGDGFNFGRLYCSQHWINTMYRRRTGKNIISKEKYGTLRFEFECMWRDSVEEHIIFLDTIRRATDKFKDIAAEIVEDVVLMCDNAPWYRGYFEAILWREGKTKWV